MQALLRARLLTARAALLLSKVRTVSIIKKKVIPYAEYHFFIVSSLFAAKQDMHCDRRNQDQVMLVSARKWLVLV